MRSVPMLRLCYSVTLLVLLIGTVLTPTPVFADAAPPPPPPGSNPMQDNPNTHVQMVSETILFDMATADFTNSVHADVTATYQMHNQGAQDEGMSVRFPLGLTSQGTCFYSQFPSITDLSVWINGTADAITISKETVSTTSAPPQQILIPCWAHFPVTFPAGKDVILKIQYTAQGSAWKDLGGSGDESWEFGGDNPSAMLSYDYVLETGAGWFGPVGSANFVLRLPYQVNQKNVDFQNLDNSWKMDGNDLRWHNENFEPAGNLQIDLVAPPVWQTILRENQIIQTFPNDEATWGRLATAYKQAIWSRRGLRSDPAGLDMYALSDQAYQKAIAVLPKDAELHFGYAQLLCWHAQWGYAADAQYTNPDWSRCFQQLKTTLEIAPQHAKANLALKTIAQFFPGSVDLNGAKPDYLLLTPHPSETPGATETISPTQLPPTLTATIQATPTAPPSTPIPLPTQPAAAEATAVPVSPASTGTLGYCAIGLAVVAVLIGILIWSYKRLQS